MNKITRICYDVLGDKTLIAVFRQDDKDIPRCRYASSASAYRLIWLLHDKGLKVVPTRYGWYVNL